MNASDTAANIILNLREWAKQPFDSQMNLGRWFLFTGLVMTLVVAWTMILRDLKGEI